ncbi:serine/threonine protein kinase [Brasilonema octagenarum]|uniref:non-specific serine/threonine protein kinase n=1 Tax=Brasilonema octagenarum UFV-OR1 TaxID=417115 RepID=A0ABX1M839_9CYAN|nr:serine/threonine protein kinase [Brasilonema octagenarum]NMF63300.1 serine/threonine protein kinase [Brasilonema octagenarum UFV-OR1]
MIGKLLDHRYRLNKVLATGGFGETYIAQDTKRPGNPVCVVKHLKPANSEAKMFDTAKRLFQGEAETLEHLGNHDQIPRLLAYFDEHQEFYLVQEFIEGHPLGDELVPNQRWSESQVIELLMEVLDILKFVHGQGVIHRDIKPDNIIRRASNKRLVLVDFGAVKQLRGSGGYGGRSQMFTVHHSATVAIGTPGYMPTEQGQGKPRPNSDMYALGIIAIQALTGIAPVDFQEDPNTGEILWQHLVSISDGLEAVLTKMVHYHFKDRFQSASEALQALQPLSFTSYTPSEYTNTTSNHQPSKSSSALSPLSRQKTIAVAPANPVLQLAPPTPKSPSKGSSGPDLLQFVIIGILVAGAAAVSPGVFKNVQSFASTFAINNDTLSAENCLAVVQENSNIRSEPTSINDDSIIKTVKKDAKFEVTSRRTKRGWVEIKLDSTQTGWANSEIIKNNEQWVSCLRDKGTAIKTVDDNDLIVAHPAPKPKAEPLVNAPTSSSPESEQSQTSKSLSADKSTPATVQGGSTKVVEEAKQKYESGDLQGAIALLKTMTANPTAVKQTTEMISQWQQDWSKAESLFKDLDTALGDGQWDKVLAYKDHPEKLPNIQYWRNKVEPLVQQAAANLAKQQFPQLGNPTNLYKAKLEPQNSSEDYELNMMNDFDNIETPEPQETPQNHQ